MFVFLPEKAKTKMVLIQTIPNPLKQFAFIYPCRERLFLPYKTYFGFALYNSISGSNGSGVGLVELRIRVIFTDFLDDFRQVSFILMFVCLNCNQTNNSHLGFDKVTHVCTGPVASQFGTLRSLLVKKKATGRFSYKQLFCRSFSLSS